MISIQALEVYYDRIRINGRDYADTFLQALYYEKRWFNTPELSPVPDNKRV
jgi:hypothetical protein